MRGAGFGIVVVLVGQFCVLPRLALAAPAARQEAEDGSLDPVSPSTMYSACQEIFLQKSTAGGAFGSWNSAQAGINPADRVDFIPPLVIDAAHSSTLYFGTYRIWQTKDGASSWNAISPDLTNGPSFWGVVTNVAAAPSDSNTVYAVTGDSNVQTSANAGAGSGATWSNITGSTLPPRIITSVAVDPLNAGTAYVGFSGFSGFGDTAGHIFRTANRGAGWDDITGNLPNVPVNAVVVNAAKPAQIFVGTDIGVFYSSISGNTWTSLVDGLPRAAVTGLVSDSVTKTLRATTYGRGAWDIKIATLR